MDTALAALFSNKFVVGSPVQKLVHLSDKTLKTQADFCVVLQPKSRKYLGMVRLADFAGTPGSENRVLIDLIGEFRYLDVLPETPVELIENLLNRGRGAVAVVDRENQFLGVITRESHSAWLLRSMSGRPPIDGADLLPFDRDGETEKNGSNH